MEIYGIGTDIIEISRIEKAINQTSLFKRKVYTEKEIEHIEKKKLSISKKKGIRMPAMQGDLLRKRRFPRRLELGCMGFR